MVVNEILGRPPPGLVGVVSVRSRDGRPGGRRRLAGGRGGRPRARCGRPSGSCPVRQRAVIVLRYYEDLTEGQIATVLGCSPGTVKSQASAALANLRRNGALRDGAEA